MSLHSQHYPMFSSFDDCTHSITPCSPVLMTKFDKAMVCGCVYSSGMDWHREGWTGEAIV